MTFTNYLQDKRCSPVTIDRYGIYIKRFLNWLEDEQLEAEAFTYTDLLEFMRYCHGKGISKRSVHSILCIVRHYCNYLICEERRSDNPASGVFIKGLIRKLPVNLLSMEEMEELYRHYSLQLSVDSSKKSMLGLLVFQGLTVGEIMRLKIHHIRLAEGKLVIKGTRRTNERTMNLEAVQIPELQNHLKANKFKEGTLFTEQTRKLISERNINNRLKYMMDQLRKLNPKVISAKQIRSSVITEWLRKNHLRQVQYMAGHKYVSSTERYQTTMLEDLQTQLKEHHPMR